MAQAVQEMEDMKAEAAAIEAQEAAAFEEQEAVAVDAQEVAAAEASKEVTYDVELDSGIEWEVETVPAEESEDNDSYGEGYEDGYYDALNRDIPYARHYNKHLFTWLFSFCLGIYGVDRFCRGQIALGVFKVLTFGGLGFWYLADWIIAMIKSYSPDYMNTEDLLFDENGRYIN